MNFFDSAIISRLNTIAKQSEFFDILVVSIAHNPLLKGGVLAAILWWAWSKSGACDRELRAKILATVLVCLPSIALARGLAVTLPFRLRPLHDEGIGFLIPYGVDPAILDNWSSFPSDHAVLFFTLSTGILFLSKKAGWFALAYSAVFICLPRVYLGLHYPTDIIAGAALGIIIGYAGNIYILNNGPFKSALDWLETKPSLFYPAFFLMTYQIADLFSSSRGLLRGVVKLLRIVS